MTRTRRTYSVTTPWHSESSPGVGSVTLYYVRGKLDHFEFGPELEQQANA